MLTQEEIHELSAFRRMLHANPELSGYEVETEKAIFAQLKIVNANELVQIGQHGVLAVFEGSAPGDTTLLRADTDALPIQELNDIKHISQSQGVAHLCGHDGHTATMLGVARELNKNPPKKGRVVLLFQPAEENGRGAIGVYQDEKFKKYEPNRVFAWHNIPGAPLKQIIVKSDIFTAAAKSIIIKLTGKTSHAAEPEMGVNPALAMAAITQQVLELVRSDFEKPDFQLITPVYASMGEKAYGVSAGEGELHFTLRTFDNALMQKLDEKIQAIAMRIAKEQGLQVSFDYTESFEANENNPACTERVKQAALKARLNVCDRKAPFKWGEDFGVFSSRYPGCMFGIGAGEDCPALHNPDYDFPDELIPVGTRVLVDLVTSYHH